MTLAEARLRGERLLQEKGIPYAKRDARILLCCILGISRAAYYTHHDEEIEPVLYARYEAAVAQRALRMPVQYVCGIQEFWGISIAVGPGVLIPRPESELLVEKALEKIPPGESVVIADLGCGSGALSIAVAKERPRAKIDSVESEAAALYWAKLNIAKQGLAAQIELISKDMRCSLEGYYDIIISNPPYIAHDALEFLAPEVRFEPLSALDGGKDGLDFYPLLAELAMRHLGSRGSLLVEIGAGQSNAVMAIFAAEGLKQIECSKDLAGLPRVVTAQKP